MRPQPLCEKEQKCELIINSDVIPNDNSSNSIALSVYALLCGSTVMQAGQPNDTTPCLNCNFLSSLILQ